MGVSLNGGTPKTPQNDHFYVVGKHIVVGYHHFRKPPDLYWFPTIIGWKQPSKHKFQIHPRTFRPIGWWCRSHHLSVSNEFLVCILPTMEAKMHLPTPKIATWGQTVWLASWVWISPNEKLKSGVTLRSWVESNTINWTHLQNGERKTSNTVISRNCNSWIVPRSGDWELTWMISLQ